MKPNEPSLGEWRDLHAAAAEFRAVAPWQWMDEMDLFGVTDPETGDVGYCSIMGQAGEHFAMAVYEGSAGLESLLRLEAMGETAVNSMEASLSQRCLMASFEDRKYIENEDYKIIKALELKFRGKNAWPLFRRMRPFRLPWALDAHQARFLAIALRQALDVSLRYKDDPELLGSRDNPTFLIRTSKPGGAGLEWFDVREDAPEFDEPEPVAAYVPNDFEAEKIRRLPIKPISLQVDFMLMPAPVDDEEGAYFPYLLMAVEPVSTMVLTVHTSPPWDYSESFAQALLQALETIGARPQELHVGRPELVDLFAEVEARCGIPVVLSDEMDALDNFFKGLLQQLGYD